MAMSQQYTQRRCPNCGLDNDPDAVYCGGCQYHLTKDGTSSTTDLRRATFTPVDNLIGATLPTFYPGIATPKKRNFIRVAFFTTLAILIIGALILGISIGKQGTQATNGTTNNIGKSPLTAISPTPGNTPAQENGTSTTTIPSPTSPPITPTPIPSLCSPTPCVLYQAGGSNGWTNWAFSSDWRQVTNGIVISNGGGSPPSAVSPYTVPTGINYAVEAEMMTPDTTSQWWEYGVAACGATQGNQWTGYVGRIAKDYSPVYAITTRFSSNGGSDFGQHIFDPGTGWHTFRLEVRGNIVTFKVDGAPVVQASDEEFIPCGSQVGFYDGGGVQREVEVRSFRVFAI